ncbi:Fe-S oxidoreductase [Paraburkholderia sp. CI2]|nr:Fe-S oxidoreductase [Paraburkholderia sp. CI2]
MKVALFIPSFIDAIFHEVRVATLERLGCEVAYLLDQTCCGQPMGNSGCERDAAATEALFVKNLADVDYIVAPSGSCVHHVRHHLTAIDQTAEVKKVRSNTFELVEFLHDVLKVDAFPWAEFPHKVGLHNRSGRHSGRTDTRCARYTLADLVPMARSVQAARSS